MEPQNETHLDPTAEISLDTVKGRTVKGIVTLTSQYFVLTIVNTLSMAYLGAFLNPVFFGIFGLVSAIINFISYFSDVGLAASLIQKKEKVTNDDLTTTFSVQQTLVIILLILLFFATPYIKLFYKLDQSSIYLLYALGFSFFMSSLKTIPSVILERHLRFEVIAFVGIVETLIYNIVLVFFAWKGFGITSFTAAVLARAIFGLVAMYTFQPWRPSLGFSRSSLKKLLSFGIPYQINTFIAVVKDDGLTIILGRIIGLSALGILSWAQGIIQIPLRIILDNVTRVTFPSFSRMQENKKDLEKSVTRSIFFLTFTIFPMVIGIVILSPVIFKAIPKYNQWLPAVVPLSLLAINVIFATVTTQLTNLLNAIGKIKITSIFMVMWTVLTWLLVPILGLRFGVNGASLGYALVGSSSIVTILVVRRFVDFSINESIFKPLFGVFVMSVPLVVLRNFLPVGLYSAFVLVIVGVATYFSTIFILVGGSIINDIRKVFLTLFHKNAN